MFTMNCNTESQLSDVKQEMDAEFIAELKLEPKDIKIETEDCDIKDEIYSSYYELVPTIDIKSEVKGKQIVDEYLENCGNKSEVDQLCTEEDETVTTGGKTCACTLNKCSCFESSHKESVQIEYNSEVTSCSDDKNMNMVSDNTQYTPELTDAETNEKLFKCIICCKTYLSKYHLIMHACTCTNEGPFSCSVCCKSFHEKDGLSRHDCCNIIQKQFRCEICFKSLSRKRQLIEHMRTHTKEKPFNCSVCYKSFLGKDSLTKHIRTHAIKKPFGCDICSKSFSRRYDLEEHMRTHTKEKPFKCSICSKPFSRRYHVVIHMRIHTKEKPYKCSMCTKSFCEKNRLVTHIRSHTKEKPFKCSFCSKSFSHRFSHNRHKLTHANNGISNVASVCNNLLRDLLSKGKVTIHK